MAASIRSMLENFGYAFIPKFEDKLSTQVLLGKVGLGISFGTNGPVHQLTPKSISASTFNTYSGHYGFDAFPFHTDMSNWHVPPRFLLLRAVNGHADVSTPIVDGFSLFNGEEFASLCQALVKPRRPIQGKFPLLTLCAKENGGARMRWDERYLVPASDKGKAGIRLLQEKLKTADIVQFNLANLGDTLILDNWRVLHGRDAIPEDAKGRVIDRAYLGGIN